MDNQLLDSLKADIAGGRCLVVVGTGVTSAVTEKRTASWYGLLESGLARVEALGAMTPEDQARVRSWVGSTASSDELLLAASKLVKALGGSDGGEFGIWLREDVGYLSRELVHPGIVEAIGALGLPIVTTNYDDVLSAALGRDYITWQDAAQVHRVIRGQSDDVLHLHGHWKYPSSVILTSEQYELMLADQSLTALRQAMAAMNSLIFVGFGEGLSDPNFGRLREWIHKTLPFQELRHYRLCRESDMQELNELHSGNQFGPSVTGQITAILNHFCVPLLLVKGMRQSLL